MYFLKLVFLLLLLTSQQIFSDNVGLLIMATGKYIQFVDPLISSARKHFCDEHKVTYFVFTDAPRESKGDVVYLSQNKLGWPYDTMMRYHTYLSYRDDLAGQDYLFACDADMLFVDEVGSEILGERVATIHPGFYNKRGSYDTNPESLAYVGDREGKHYYAGGFYGGSSDEFFRILEVNSSNIDNDLERGVIAVWHDESHWNRYCIDNKPTIILSPSYCYPEDWDLPFKPRLLALNKIHAEVRAD
jgi:histo-blood group ABO system transferase